MVFALGVVLFAIGIGASIALHELGHLVIAKAFGMKVRRYFIGFGPQLFAFRRGETVYGLKAIPAGGFCDIAGMTALDEMTADEAPRAMYKQSAWKRILVMLGGPITHFLLGFVLLYITAVGWYLPNLDASNNAVVGSPVCVAPAQGPAPDYALADCTGPGPAELAGLRSGDVITAVNGTPTQTFADVVSATRPLTGTADYTIERDGETLQVPIDVTPSLRYVVSTAPGADPTPTLQQVGSIGVQSAALVNEYDAVSAVPGTISFTGTMAVETGKALLRFPERVPSLVSAIGGAPRDENSPISVVGASRLGGEVADAGQWQVFLLLLASLNFFIGVFNLLPLLPLDGGHMAVTLYEKVRDSLRRARGRPPGEPVDYTKLAPVTYVVLILGGGVTLLAVVADVVNPITLGL